MHNPLVVLPARHIYMLSFVLGMAQDLFYFVLFGLLFRRRRWSGVCSLCDHYGFPTSRGIGKCAFFHLRLLLLGLVRSPWRRGILLSRGSARSTSTWLGSLLDQLLGDYRLAARLLRFWWIFFYRFLHIRLLGSSYRHCWRSRAAPGQLVGIFGGRRPNISEISSENNSIQYKL